MEQIRKSKIESGMHGDLMYHKGRISVKQKKNNNLFTEVAQWARHLEEIHVTYKNKSQVDSRFKCNQKIKLLGKIRRIINLEMRETFLNRTENSDAINEKADIFDNIPYNLTFFYSKNHKHK